MMLFYSTQSVIFQYSEPTSFRDTLINHSIEADRCSFNLTFLSLLKSPLLAPATTATATGRGDGGGGYFFYIYLFYFFLLKSPLLAPAPTGRVVVVDKSWNRFKFVSVLLSTSVERVGVSRMRDFSDHILYQCHTNFYVYHRHNNQPNDLWKKNISYVGQFPKK